MSTLFDVLSGVPSRVTAGEQASWAETFSEYPNSTFAVAYVFTSQTPVDGYQTYTVAGAETETAKRTFTLAADMKPGIYEGRRRFTRQSDAVARFDSCRICMIVAPDPTVTPTVTEAQTNVTALQALLASGSASASTTVSWSFNGQSGTKTLRGIDQVRSELTFWMSRLEKERRALDQLSAAVAEYNSDCCC